MMQALTPIRALIIDDEQAPRNVLKNYLRDYCPQLQVLGEAEGVSDGYDKIRALLPNLIFLDINLLDGTGFDLIDKFPCPDFCVIFTTAYDYFALKAFKYSAVDYLLKPYDLGDLVDAVEKMERHFPLDSLCLLKELLEKRDLEASFKKIALSSQEGMVLLALKNIVRAESSGCYTTFLTKSGERHTVSRTLKEFEQLLPADMFVRVHTSHILNLRFVKKFQRKDGGTILMKDGSCIPISRRRRDDFLRLWKVGSLG